MPDKPVPLRLVGEAAAAEAGPPRLDSHVLLQGGREVVIVHDGADYRLRLTANGKLILTK